MILRTATSSDVEALLDVEQPGAVESLGHIFPQDQHPFPRGAIATRWLAEIADSKINVHLYTEHDGTIRGFAAVRHHELLHFGTALDTWGTGLASRFHDALLAATACGITPPTLMLRVFEENRRARRFYEKHGLQPTGRSSRTTFPPHPLLLEYERHLPQIFG
jgi:RimJ/RimL family protein N-acetyltransferase